MARSKREIQEIEEESVAEVVDEKPAPRKEVKITAAKFVKTANTSPGIATILLQRDRKLWLTAQEWEQRVADLTN
jgi:hypothetical protein